MLDFIKKLFGDKNARQLKRLQPRIEEINAEYEKLADLSEEALKAKTGEFKARIRSAVEDIEADIKEVKRQLNAPPPSEDVGGDGQSDDAGSPLSRDDRFKLYEELDDLEREWLKTVEAELDAMLPEAFAVAKEVCRRHVGKSWEAGGQEIEWNMVPYDVQLIGGMAMHDGNISEMKTGEGKTLVAVAPVYLNALVGRGVHLVTVNPYLAQRDAEWMGPIYDYLGLTIDIIDKYEPHSEGRKAAYRADITYGTNNEFGFDYLRDNSFVTSPDQLVQRGHHFAIVDEVDSVLVDEARTPLIISGPVPQANDSRFMEFQPPVERLVQQQQRLVAKLVSDAEKLLMERDEALAASDNKKARQLEEQAGLYLFRASRGFPKNKKLIKLLGEPGIDRLRQQTESFYLQDNAKNMDIVDDELYYAVDEKQRSLEMTEKGRQYTAKAANESPDLFVLPDVGAEIARIEHEYEAKRDDLKETLENDTSLSEDKRANKLENDLRVLTKEEEQAKTTLYTTYSERAERLHAIEQLLRAYTMYEKDIEYIVQEDKVQIVDEHTGRVLSGRRYSEGLHQAIEAKEGVKVQAATQTYATVTLQNYFRMYHKLAGMTGTAETEAEEFFKIYKMDVVVVPTNRPIARADLDDLVFKTKREKFNAVLDKIEEYHQKGQPVLVGTTSVEESEKVARLLKRKGIRHNVLNARQDRAQSEAVIVSEAGKEGAVTIATNMAGRGTDIKLGKGVIEAGGLAIIGTERHESRRIDLQLRGRAGRQGDPGESQFYVSLEDNLMRLFTGDRVARVMDRLNLEDGAVITHPWVNKSIERAQKKVEQNNFAIRKRQLDYDDVLNAQREVIYDRRVHALKGERLRGDILDMLYDLVEGIVGAHYDDGNIEELREELLRVIALDWSVEREEFLRLGEDGVVERVMDAAVDFHNRKRSVLAQPFHESMLRLMNSDQDKKPERVYVDFTDGRRLMRAVVNVEDAIGTRGEAVNDAMERVAMLSLIDQYWTEHLRNLDEVKEGIGLRAFGQRDPLVEYKMEAYKLFTLMLEKISQEVVSFIFRAGPVVDGGSNRRPRQQPRGLDRTKARTSKQSNLSYGVGGNTESSADRDPTAKQERVIVEERVGRNDPCPCGSGKKYKHCHGRNA